MTMREKTSKNMVVSGTGKTSVSMTLRKNTSIRKPDERTKELMSKSSAHMGEKKGYIVFSLDATASRHERWEEAKVIQRKMFDTISTIGKMYLRLMYYGGKYFNDMGWNETPVEIMKHMDKVECVPGETQLIEIMKTCCSNENSNGIQSVLFVGDCFEENSNVAEFYAKQMKMKKIKMFCCQDGENEIATTMFAKISSITGGKHFRLGDDMPLDEICENVAIMTIGGLSTLRRLGKGKSSKILLEHYKGK